MWGSLGSKKIGGLVRKILAGNTHALGRTPEFTPHPGPTGSDRGRGGADAVGQIGRGNGSLRFGSPCDAGHGVSSGAADDRPTVMKLDGSGLER